MSKWPDDDSPIHPRSEPIKATELPATGLPRTWPTQLRASHDHVYLSTACFHEFHEYCKSMTGYQGSKRPGKCKFCNAQCVCSCHMAST